MLGITKGAGGKGNRLLAVNLHWLPEKVKYEFWNYLLVTWENLKAKGKEKTLPLLVYQDMKNNPNLRPCKVAIRKYALSKIRVVKKVPEEHFDKIFVKYQKRMRYKVEGPQKKNKQSSVTSYPYNPNKKGRQKNEFK